ncbi:cellulase family glycosylhydrolase [Sphingomonas xinjiangensis]|uniref:Glycoside hydrolase family 5 domain-containing protein n=1 Tax=Sphingomonas xinjiangensis TaxID=643568 RepID=A0A840YBC9_9SPHN|nr:cellulase family glycosylhydrolase [Sphingomonas xinjiangensis]MBB5709339.1 hypothetical protein [Sphingomonas xinjiangensis]
MKTQNSRKLAVFSAVSAFALAVSAVASQSNESAGILLTPAAAPAPAMQASKSGPSVTLPVASAVSSVPKQTVAVAKAAPLFGANLSGAEANGSDVLRPSLWDLQGYVERYNYKLIRYPFIDNRMTAARIVELRTLTEYARSKGVRMILDNHTYKWKSVQEMVTFWTTFARNFSDDGSVILDLVNEPSGFNDPVLTNDWMQWVRDSKLVIAGLRANGIKHPIALEYPQWSATFRFDKGEAAAMACESAGCALDRDKGGPLDPLNLTYINAHRYWDKGSSGTNGTCDLTWGPTSGIDSFAAQLRKRNLKGVITEAAFGSSYGTHATCAEMGKDAIADIKANGDVLLGVTWWGGGRMWPEKYHFKIEPKKDTRFQVEVTPFIKQLRGD